MTIKNERIKVTAIGKNAFKDMKNLKKVVIGKNVISIGKNAFQGDKKLKQIQIKGSGLKSVGKNAFKGISSRAVIKVPKAKKKAYIKILKNKGLKNVAVKS